MKTIKKTGESLAIISMVLICFGVLSVPFYSAEYKLVFSGFVLFGACTVALALLSTKRRISKQRKKRLEKEYNKDEF